MLRPRTTHLREAVHRHRSLSKEGLLERLFTLWFQGLVYTQIWEDPQVDAEALRLGAHSRIVTVSSAGCNVLNYLTYAPERILAVDVNAAHMALTRLRIAALRHLPSHEAFFQFFGVGAGPENIEGYRTQIRSHLDAATRRYWEARPMGGLRRPRIAAFREGFYEQGILSRFQGIAGGLSNLIQGRRPEQLLSAASRAEQREFFDDCVAPFFDHGFVQWFAGRPAALYSLGIPPRQFRRLEEAGEGSVVDVCRDRLERLVCGFPIEDNYFAWQAFGRQYDTEQRQAVPAYLRKMYFAQLRYHADRIRTRLVSLTDALREEPDGTFNSFALLDAMDWMGSETIRVLWGEIARVGMPGARIVFRTAGTDSPVEPALPEGLRSRFTYARAWSEKLHARDRSAVYGMVHLYILTG